MTNDAVPEPWVELASRPGPSGHVRVATVSYRFPDGHSSDWDLITGPDVVAVLALTRASEVVLARQFRPGPSVVCDELPGGIVDPGETPLEAAARELLEETGYAGEVEIIGSLIPGATVTRHNWVALARGCERVADQLLGPDEDIRVVTRPLDEFRRSLPTAAMTDIAAAYRALDFLGYL